MNPIPYQNLMDLDGLKMAIKDAEKSSDEFSTAVTEDFKRSQNAAAALRKELEGINAAINGKTIKLTDDSAQAQVVAFASQVANLTKQYKDQQAAIEAMNKVLQSNKVAVGDAKTAEAQYQAQLAKGKSDQQQVNVAIANTTLRMKELALANKQGAQSMTTATGSYKEAQARLTALGNSIKSAKDGFTSTSPAIQQQIKEYNQLNDQLKKFDASMGNHQRNVGSYKDALNSVGDELKSYITNLLSLAAAMELVKKTFEAALETDAVRTSLGYLLESTELADQKMRMLKETSNRLGLEFVSTAQAYAMFTGAAKASNFSLNEADKIFNSVSRVLGVLHVPAEGAQRAFYALQEMISMGTIQSRQLNRMLGLVIPGSTKIMADALGVTVKQLEEMEKHGELLTSDVLPKFAAQLDKSIAPGVEKIDSLQAAWNNLKNTFTETVDENSHIGDFFKTLLNGVNELASSVAKTVNSTSWQEFWKRALPHAKTDNSADIVHDLQAGADASRAMTGLPYKFAGNKDEFTPAEATKNVKDLTIALDEATKTYDGFAAAYKKGQVKESGSLTFKNLAATRDDLKAMIELYKTEYPNALDVSEKKVIESTDTQLTSVAEIRKRIEELQKLPGSAEKGNPIEVRIEALKARLKELTATVKKAKDGFQILEDQINKMLLKLQDSIVKDFTEHQGKQTAQTLKLADAYERLVAKLNDYKKAQADAINESNRQHQIKQYGAVYPGAPTPTGPSKLSKNDQTKLTVGDNNEAINADEIDIDKVVIKYSEGNKKILESYRARNIDKAEMDKQLAASDYFQAQETYKLNLDIVDKQLDNAKLTYSEDSKQYSALLAHKAQLTKSYYDGNFKFLEEELAREKKRLEDVYNDIFSSVDKGAQIAGNATGSQGVTNALTDAGNGIKKLSLSQQPGEDPVTDAQKFQLGAQIAMDATQAYTDFAIQASQQRQAALEKEMQYEIQGAGNNKEAKLRIEYEYNKRISDEKRKQAKAQKGAAAVEIILNTAIAISKTLAETAIFGIPLIPIIAALGAIELGIVLAQPLPQFAKGREDGPATFAEVNERGPEALVKGDRVRFANKGKRGVTYLDRGEKVLTADKTNQLLNRQIAYQNDAAENVSQSRVIYDRYISTSSQNSKIDYDKIGDAMNTAVDRIPIEQNIMDERGFSRYLVTKNTRIKSVRDRNTL